MRTSTLISALAVAAPAAFAQDTAATDSTASTMASTMASSTGSSTASSASSSSSAMSLCDKYTSALLKENTAKNQYTLLTLLVNTAVIGNYTTDPAPKNAVTGILNNGTYDGRPVSLLKYFDGMLASNNRGGDSGVAVNSLDGGGADPLKNNKPANDETSNQYFLLTHLYSYFGALLECSTYSKQGFPAYSGDGSQYDVHKFMDLSHDEVSYFIQEVGLAATSFGVTADEAMAVGKKLDSVFNYKCSANATVIPAQGPQQQAICIADDCPLAPNAVCSAYEKAVEPSAANKSNMYTSKEMPATMTGTATGAMGSMTGSMTGSASATDSASAESTGAASANSLGAMIMGAAGVAALAIGL